MAKLVRNTVSDRALSSVVADQGFTGDVFPGTPKILTVKEKADDFYMKVEVSSDGEEPEKGMFSGGQLAAAVGAKELKNYFKNGKFADKVTLGRMGDEIIIGLK